MSKKRIPSNRMRKFTTGKTGIIGYLLLLSAALFTGILLWKIHWLAFVVVIPLFIIYTICENKKHKQKIHKLASNRNEEDIGTFAKHFDYRKIDTWVIRAVYEQFQEYLEDVYEKFPLRPEDRIYDDLVTDPDDFEMDIVSAISYRTSRSIYEYEENPYNGKINTLEDLVYFFNLQPKEIQT